MSEKQRLLRLGRGYNGFYCADTRFHLMGGMKPQDVYPAGIPLSDAVKRALRGGTLVDVNKVIPVEEILTPKQLAAFKGTIEAVAETVQVSAPSVETPAASEPENEPVEETVEVAEDDIVGLTYEEIESKSKSELLEYIKGQELSLEELGLNSRSNAGEVKAALHKHFGHEA